MFYNNGFIVQNLLEQNDDINFDYMGLSRFKSWPLSGHNDKNANRVNELLEELWASYFNYNNKIYYAINSITSHELLLSYIKLCDKSSLRIICIETEFDFYERASIKTDKEFLGYDFLYPTDDYYSAIGNEYDIVERLGFSSELNNNGLFENIDRINDFIKARNELQKIVDIEPNDGFVLAKISKVIVW